MADKKESPYIARALDLLNSIDGEPQNFETREKISLELCSLISREAERLFETSYNRDSLCFYQLFSKEKGKAFLSGIIDQCFRKSPLARRVDQLRFLLFQIGIPKEFPLYYRLALQGIKLFGSSYPSFWGSIIDRIVTKLIEKSTLTHEDLFFRKTFEQKKRHKSIVSVAYPETNIVSEMEAKQNLRKTLCDIANPEVHHISLKLSSLLNPTHELSLYSQKELLYERLRTIFREIMKHNALNKKTLLILEQGIYHFLDLTISSFQDLLNEVEFSNLSIGITLQAYLPESFSLQEKLTLWAKERLKSGKAPIILRLVKGGYLGEEKVIASKKGWKQATYQSKTETDAQFKRMVIYGLAKENIQAVHLSIATHNIFDLAYILCLVTESKTNDFIDFEFYENRLPHFRNAFQKLIGKDILVYNILDPLEERELFCSSLLRRFDDMGGSENFFTRAHFLFEDKTVWQEQETLFLESLKKLDFIIESPRRTQVRSLETLNSDSEEDFGADPQTDFSLLANRIWAKSITEKWKNHIINPLPIVIGKEEIVKNIQESRKDPSCPDRVAYHYSLAGEKELDQALVLAHNAQEQWNTTSKDFKFSLLSNAIRLLKNRREDLIGSLMLDSGKILYEADIELSDAIDSIEYALSRIKKIDQLKDLEWTPKGNVLIAPPRGLPCSMATSSITAALVSGNSVLFKPAPENILIGLEVAKIFWDSGIPKELLQFIPCAEELLSSFLLKDPRIHSFVTKCQPCHARHFYHAFPFLSLEATMPGKNTTIISSLSDRDLVIKDLVISAFSHAGQKHTSTSLAILESDLFDDPDFQTKLKCTVESLIVGSVWDLSTEIPPLIRPLTKENLQAILSLEPGEEWLIKPSVDDQNPYLCKPGIKWNVKPESSSFKNVYLAPILSVARANTFKDCVDLANKNGPSLVTTLYSLDEREHAFFIKNIESSTYFINHRITDSIVRKTPVGGDCSLGSGYKDGGPNFIFNFSIPKQLGLPKEKLPINSSVNHLTTFIEKIDLSAEELGIWYSSIANYAYWWNRLKHRHDPSKIIGQDNLFGYIPRKDLFFRIDSKDNPFDILRICAASLTCGATLTLSWQSTQNSKFDWNLLKLLLNVEEESEEDLIKKIKQFSIQRLRILSPPSNRLLNASREFGCILFNEPVLSNGRIELLRCLKEITKSHDYHRYGNLGLRECDLRRPLS